MSGTYKYIDEIELTTEDSPLYMGLVLEFFGDSLDECLDNATLTRVDQDGGDHGTVDLYDSSHYEEGEEYIREFCKKIDAEYKQAAFENYINQKISERKENRDE